MNATPAQIEAAMDEWLTTEGLTMAETTMIQTLKAAVSKGVEEFLVCAAALYGMMPAIVRPAIKKAREQGLCQEWPNA